MAELEAECLHCFAEGPSWISPTENVARLVVEAAAQGARVLAGEVNHLGHVTLPLLLADAKPDMRLLLEDHFSAVAAVVSVRNDDEAVAANDECPYALGASVFSVDESAARAFATRLNVGSVVINDLIVSTVPASLDLSGRPFFAEDLSLAGRWIASFDAELVHEFFQAVAFNARMNLHFLQHRGGNAHHVAEAAFKAFGRALDAATRIDARVKGVPSTKGVL